MLGADDYMYIAALEDKTTAREWTIITLSVVALLAWVFALVELIGG